MIFNQSLWGMLTDLVNNNVLFVTNAGAPTDAVTGVGVCGPGSLLIDSSNKNLYINTNTLASPTWTLIVRNASSIVDLTTAQSLTNKIVNNQSFLNNFSTSQQSIAAATRTYITGSRIAVPSGKLQIGSFFEWEFDLTKTAAGTAASTFDVAIGTVGSTSDSAVVSFAKPGGSADADAGRVRITLTCRGPLTASGIFAGHFTLTHNLASTGHATIPVVDVNTISGVFNVTTANLILGVCLTSGAADAITINEVTAKAYNL